jgi:hypothetical protein
VSAHSVGRTSSTGDYAWFDDNLFQLRPEDDTSTFRLHSRGGGGGGGSTDGGGGDAAADAGLDPFSSSSSNANTNAAATTMAYHRNATATARVKGSYVRPGRTLRLGAAVAVGGANAQVGPIDVASLRTTYQGPDRVREKNRQRHRLRRAEKARAARLEAERDDARRQQMEESARLAAENVVAGGNEEGDTRPASFSAAARLQKRNNGKDKSSRGRSGHDDGRGLAGGGAGGAMSLVTALLSPRSSTAPPSSAIVGGGAGASVAGGTGTTAVSFASPTSADAGNAGNAGNAAHKKKTTRKQASFDNPHTSYTASGGDDWEAGEHIMEKLTSGEDAISFFAKEGNRTAVKFVYLVKSDTGDDFRPYDLDVIPTAQVNALISSSSSSSAAVTAAKAAKASNSGNAGAGGIGSSSGGGGGSSSSSSSSSTTNGADGDAAGDDTAGSAALTLLRASRTHFIMTEKGTFLSMLLSLSLLLLLLLFVCSWLPSTYFLIFFFVCVHACAPHVHEMRIGTNQPPPILLFPLTHARARAHRQPGKKTARRCCR